MFWVLLRAFFPLRRMGEFCSSFTSPEPLWPLTDGLQTERSAILLFLFNKILILFEQSLHSFYPDTILRKLAHSLCELCSTDDTRTLAHRQLYMHMDIHWFLLAPVRRMNLLFNEFNLESFFLVVIFCCSTASLLLYFGTLTFIFTYLCVHAHFAQRT